MAAVSVFSVFEVMTPYGPARVHLQPPAPPAHRAEGAASPPAHPSSHPAALVLGHGAGGGVTAPDLTAATRVAVDLGLPVALVEQPYRVAGRRAPAPAAQLDAAWTAVIADLAAGPLTGSPLVVGGRSSGARVACRTAAAVSAVAVLCLAFPVHPPGRPEKSRLAELDSSPVPTLIVQGLRDPFGMPPPGPGRTVVTLAGDHSLRSDMPGLRSAVREWLAGLT